MAAADAPERDVHVAPPELPGDLLADLRRHGPVGRSLRDGRAGRDEGQGEKDRAKKRAADHGVMPLPVDEDGRAA